MMWMLMALGCSEYSYTSKYQKDVFQQVRRNTVDVLLVVDDSCSMAEEQNKTNGRSSYIRQMVCRARHFHVSLAAIHYLLSWDTRSQLDRGDIQ